MRQENELSEIDQLSRSSHITRQYSVPMAVYTLYFSSVQNSRANPLNRNTRKAMRKIAAHNQVN